MTTRHNLCLTMIFLHLLLPPFLTLASASRCPELKTVPYVCPPGADDTSQCLYGVYHGTYSLTNDHSPFCPEDDGYSGCLYTYTGTEQHYCFKEIPTLNAKLDEAMPLYNVSRPCLANFPGIATMTEEEQASLCCGHQDCQENAGCFLDETSGKFRTMCQCFLNHQLVADSQAPLPSTGYCQPMEAPSYCSGKAECYSTVPTTTPFSICPYCKVYRNEEEVGSYVEGKGDFETENAMQFRGSSEGCPETYTGLYWYCWYDVFTDVVDLSQTYLVVEEVDECEHYAYVYTPLACPFAQQ